MKTLISIFLIFLIREGFTQTPVSGIVTDATGEPIPGANVYLLDTYDGSTTGTDGKFRFTSSETGINHIVVKFIGYKDFQKEVVLKGEPVIIEVALREEINQLEAVTITAGAFTASDESRRTIFRAADIATTAGATADIAGALNTLPGTQKVGETGRLFVRGGGGHEALTFIDGMLVLDPYSASSPNTPSRGRFLPFMFKGTSFSTGGYSAEYGQALSSALVLDSKDKAETTRTDIGLLSVGGDLTHTQVWDRASWAGKIGYTNIRPYYGFISQETDWKNPPSSIEGHSVFRQEVGKQGLLKMYGNFSHARFSLFNHHIDNASIKELYDLTNDYGYLNTTYKEVLNERWMVRGGLSYTFLQNDILTGTDNIIDTQKGFHAKTVFEGSLSEKVGLKSGVEVTDRHYGQQTRLENSRVQKAEFNERIAASFLESEIYASNRFVTRAGVRLEYNGLLHKLYADPRLSVAHKTGEHGSVSLAYGKFRQSPENELLVMNNNLKPEKADHYIASYQLTGNDRTFRAEVYYKKYDRLVKADDQNTVWSNDGSGYARGAEIFWRDQRSFKNTDYWISYSFLDTRRDYLSFPYAATPSFASAHNFSIVYKYFINRLKTQAGTTYSFASGRPYNNPNEEKFNSSRTPAYHDLSMNLAYLPRPGLIIYFSATNLTGRDNIFGYEFSDDLNTQGIYNSRAIRQPARRFLFVGVFITLSKDKSVNQLPAL